MLRTNQLPRTIYIDALSLVPAKKSGVGLTLRQTLESLANKQEIADLYTIYLVVPLGKAKYLAEYVQPNVKIKTIYLPARGMELLLRLKLFPPVDWLLGAGVYIFPNYRNWPLWRSRSATYIYDVGFVRFPETVQPKNQRYLQRYINRWIARADKIIAITQQVKEEIEIYLHVPATQVEVVNCGVDEKTFYQRSSQEIDEVKRKYQIPYDKYLLFVGNIEPRKNLPMLLAAYRKLPKNIRETYGLVIVGGDGWLNEAFYSDLTEAQSEQLKIFKVDEYVEDQDLPALYSGASALVHPALYEGFGMTPLEAAACNVPVVVSDIPAIREVILDGGYYCDPHNADSVAMAVRQALDELDTPKQKAQLHQALARANELSWDNSAKQLADVIELQYLVGPERHPLLRRAKLLYKAVDYRVRTMLGEKALQPYRPAPAESRQDLQRQLLADFAAEQPSSLQEIALKIYLSAKHVAATVVKGALRTVRRIHV